MISDRAGGAPAHAPFTRNGVIGHRITGNRKGQSNGRGKGWEYLHLAVDDHSRLAYSEIRPDEKRKSCIRFLLNASRFLRSHGVRVYPVMTDNGVSSAPIAMPRRCVSCK